METLQICLSMEDASRRFIKTTSLVERRPVWDWIIQKTILGFIKPQL